MLESLCLSPDGDCHLCPLRKSVRAPVWGHGDLNAKVAIFGEAPGKNEDKAGIPFCGRAGNMLNELLRTVVRNGFTRDQVYVDNLVKCRPPNNRDPKPEEIEACSGYINRALERLPNVEYIITLGRYSGRWFKPGLNLEMHHGIPFPNVDDGLGLTHVPLYHPAAGLRSGELLTFILEDFNHARDIITGKDDHIPKNYHQTLDYQEARTSSDVLDYLHWGDGKHVFLDTESTPSGPWSIQINNGIFGTARFIRVIPDIHPNRQDCISALKNILEDPQIITVLHNSLYDLPILADLNIQSSTVIDTMIMAYLLQNKALGLKPLAYRLAGMHMKSYKEMVSTARLRQAMVYLARVANATWPKPHGVLTFKPDGAPHVKQPQNIAIKAKNIIRDNASWTRDADPWDRWHKIKINEGRGMVEEELGPMPDGDLSHIPFGRAMHYACQDADATARVFHPLFRQIQELDLEPVLAMDMAVVPMAIDMMRNGFRINPEKFRQISKTCTKMMYKYHALIMDTAGHYVNPGSDPQIRKLLFSELGLPKPKKTTDTGLASTNDKVLSMLKDKHPVIQHTRDWREHDKLQNTYTDPIPRLAVDSRVHTTVRLTNTATGRLSSANPNFTAIPIRRKLGREIRKGFIADDGNWIVSADYSQIELRVMAHESQDPLMMEVFHKKQDIHSRTASEIFGIPIDRLHKYDHRRPAKTTNFLIPYGGSGAGLRESLIADGADPKIWTLKRCEEFIEEWFKLFPGVRVFMSEKHTEAMRYGYVRDMWGRIRRIPQVRITDKYARSEGFRQAGNMPIQSGAQGVIKKAMGDLVPVYRGFNLKGYTFNPLIQIHDDLVWEIEDRIVKVAVPLIKSIMEGAVKLRVPVIVDPEIGKSWGEMGDYEEWLRKKT